MNERQRNLVEQARLASKDAGYLDRILQLGPGSRGSRFEQRLLEARRPLLEEIRLLRRVLGEVSEQSLLLEEENERLLLLAEQATKAAPVLAAPTAPPAFMAMPAPAPALTAEPQPELIEEAPAPAPLPIAKPKPAKVRAPKQRRALPSFAPLKRLADRTVAIALIGGAGYLGYGFFTAPAETGSVAGVTTSTPSTPAAKQDALGLPTYTESFANVPFDETVWEKVYDPAFGVSLEYPKNTSNRVAAVGGNNMWFLRNNGYLLKISRFQTDKTLDEWMEEYKKDYEYNNRVSKSTFNNAPSWSIQPVEAKDGNGYQHIVKHGDTIYQVWIKIESPETDDGQRIAHMVSNLVFIDRQ